MSTISSGTTLTTALVQTGDTTGDLVIKTNNGNTTAVTFNTAGAIGVGSTPSYGSAGQYLQSAGNAAPATWATIPAATPGGSNTQVQFNNAGAFGGSANLTFNGTTLTAADITDSSLTAGRVVFPTTGGNLSGSADLFWDSANARLGIGTSSPTVRLQVSGEAIFGGAGTYQTVYANNNSATGGGAFTVQQNGTSRGGVAVSGAWLGDTSSDLAVFSIAPNIRFYNNNSSSERMRIDSSGNLIVGDTSSGGYAISARKVSDNCLMRLTAVTAGGAGIDLVNAGGSEVSYINASGNNVLVARTGGTERMRLDTSGNLLFNSGYGSVAIAYGCRAWVNFNGTGTVAIRGSGNVSSISDLNTGTYRINLSTAMPDANYSVTGTTSPNGNISDIPAATLVVSYINPPSTSSITIFTGDSRQGNFQDCPNTFVAIHR